MKRLLMGLAVAATIVVTGTFMLAHPHLRTTVTVELPSGVEATITYNTVPVNLARATNAAEGSFLNPGRASLKLSGEVKAGSVTIPEGDYTLGVIKKSGNDWTLGLYPGSIARGQSAQMSKVIELDSSYSAASGMVEHMLIDFSPGSGDFAGKSVITLRFGSMSLSGLLS